MPRKMTMFSARRLVLVLAFSIASTAVVAAQSGRRATTKPLPPPVSEPKDVETKPEKAARIQLLVGLDDPSWFDGTPFYLSNTLRDECLKRLGESSGVDAKPAVERMTRADALKIAKRETQRYVVWLQLGSDVAESGRQVSNREEDELYVSYFVLEPATAKVTKSGRTSYSMYKKGNVGISSPSRRNTVYHEHAARELGREVADKILAAFAIKINPWPR
jgi:hypothetical protein